jgi:hypothetical protein
MQRPFVITLSAVALLSLAAAYGASTALVPGDPVKEHLTGVWSAVAVNNILEDGRVAQSYGANPAGSLMLDANGHFSMTLIRSDLPRFSSNNRDMGTPEENQAVVQGTIANFGTYSISEAGHALLMHVESSSFPNWKGTTQRRLIATLSRDELRWHNPTASNGGTAEIIWKRSK